jgi:anti-sigma-K factor RskA
VLAVVGWWPRLAEVALGPERARAQMLAAGGPAVGHWPWAHESGLAATVSGDVVWDGARQRGYLTLTGLPANERGRQQYQLWIFDAARDDRYPVDGGVFDVPADSDRVVVPIRASVRVSQPVAFALTLEPAGGVVVSDRTHLVAMARTSPR